MKKARQLLLLFIVCGLLLSLFGCGGTERPSAAAPAEQSSATPTPEPQPVSLIISAAASLKDSMEEIKQLYATEKPHITITYNFGSSGSLQQQIEQGAPADIFMSAAAKQMNALKEKALVLDDTVKNLLENEVVLITPKSDTAVKDFTDLTGDRVKKIALGEPKSVPVGQYAEEILTFLQIKEQVRSKAVYGNDVKEVLTWVETGNADAGIVYATDAKISDKVTIAARAPENSHAPVIYPAAVIKASANPEAAKEFLSYLSGDQAKAVFEKYGFSMAK